MWFVIPYWEVQSYMRCVTKPHEKWGEPVVLLRTVYPSMPLLYRPGLFQNERKAHGPSQLSRQFHLLGNITHHQLSRCHWPVQPIGRKRIIKERELLLLWLQRLDSIAFPSTKLPSWPFTSFLYFSRQNTFNHHSLASTHCCQKSESVHMSTSHICNGYYFNLRKKCKNIYIHIYIYFC